MNFRVDAAVMQRFLPAPFRPKLHRGHAIAGICLIRLEAIRPIWLPPLIGMTSENAAHRIAVIWEDDGGHQREGVFIPRRDTGSWLTGLGGGRIFPGEHHRAKFEVEDDGTRVSMVVRSRDGEMRIQISGEPADSLPATSCFSSLAEASAFFEAGSVGYSVTRNRCRFDGIRLELEKWSVRPLALNQVEASFFADPVSFPQGSVTFDHALIMRDLRHQWHGEPDLFSHPDIKRPGEAEE